MKTTSQLSAFICLFITTSALALPPADIGLEFDPPENLIIQSIGEFTADPGLEYVAIDEFAVVRLYRNQAPYSLGALPAPFNVGTINEFVRDLDDDGYAELFCWNSFGQSQYQLGVVDFDGGPNLLWSTVWFSNAPSGVDLMKLNSAEPHAIVVQLGRRIHIYAPLTGDLLYDTGQDPSLDPNWGIDTYLLDDFDGDGFDELLVSTSYLPDPNRHRAYVIGDRTVSPTATTGWGSSQIQLMQSWPNPAHGSTQMAFALGQPGRVNLRIYDAAGRLVRTVVDGEYPAGRHVKLWDGKDDGDKAVASGIYYYELNVDGKRESRKLVQIR